MHNIFIAIEYEKPKIIIKKFSLIYPDNKLNFPKVVSL